MPVKIVERLGLPCAYRGVGTSGNIRWHSSLITINRRRSAARLPVLLTSGVAPAGGVRGGSHRTALRARRRATADRSADTQRAVQRLERDVGTPLLTRTTRRVALTGAGFELLGRAKVILDDVAAANAAVRRVASGEAARFASASHHQSCQCLRLTLPQHCSRGHQTSPSRCEGCGSPI